MALATMQKAHLDSVMSDVHGKISKKTVELDTVKVTRVRFDVGAKWSADLKEYAGTSSCLLPHVAYVLSGQIKIRMDDGSEELFSPGDVMMLPPRHDSCVKRQWKLDWERHEEVDPRVGAGLPRWVHRSLPRRPLASELRALAPGAGPSHGLPGQA